MSEELHDYYGVLLSSCNSTRWDQVTWCTEQFGKAGDFTNIVACRWYHHGNRFGFLNEADRDWFVLRWS